MIDTSKPEYQVVPQPVFLVRCACGYAHDSYAESAEKAIAEIRLQHEPSHTDWTAAPYPGGFISAQGASK